MRATFRHVLLGRPADYLYRQAGAAGGSSAAEWGQYNFGIFVAYVYASLCELFLNCLYGNETPYCTCCLYTLVQCTVNCPTQLYLLTTAL
jgi:hypothetical protein